MPQIREEADADTTENYNRYTDHKTNRNKFEVLCGTCAKVCYVDEKTHENFVRSMEHNPDNPFLCDACLDEYNDLAYAAR
jgi:ferredoxin